MSLSCCQCYCLHLVHVFGVFEFSAVITGLYFTSASFAILHVADDSVMSVLAFRSLLAAVIVDL